MVRESIIKIGIANPGPDCPLTPTDLKAVKSFDYITMSLTSCCVKFRSDFLVLERKSCVTCKSCDGIQIVVSNCNQPSFGFDYENIKLLVQDLKSFRFKLHPQNHFKNHFKILKRFKDFQLIQPSKSTTKSVLLMT